MHLALLKTLVRQLKVCPEKMVPAALKESDDEPNANHYGLFYNGPSAISI